MKRHYENPQADQWYLSLAEHPEKIPFLFEYNHSEYTGFAAPQFTLKDKQIKTEGSKETRTFVYSFADELKISLILTHYFSHGVTEWTVWFENTGTENSGILSKLRTELTFTGTQPVLKGILGDHVNQYTPYNMDLAGLSVDFSSDSGRATHINFPYFNLEYGSGGVMLAIGWAGTWNARFTCRNDRVTYTANAVNGLHTYLKPGEKIRTALFVTAPYTVRNEQYATNFWRSWFIEHNLPKENAAGDALQPFTTCCFANDTGLPNSDGSISERYSTWKPTMDKMIEVDAKVDYRWFDAGWYVRPDGGSEETDWWGSIGTWELDPVKWPGDSFLKSTEYGRKNGIKTLVWFEPERVTDPENLAKNFGYNTDWAIRMEGERAISNNIGDPGCLAWTTERICKMLRENKVEMYREDNNSNQSRLWAHLDSCEGEGREGITECKFINAHYQMWDDIIACTLSYGGCGFVDSCASGGGRNDLESMRRGVPLLRSDSDRTSTALRLSMSSTFNKWIPFSGANSKEKLTELALTGTSDPYTWRASYLPCLNVDSQFAQDPEQDFDVLRFGLKEWKKVAPYLLKEFYVLTPWHKEQDTSDFTSFCYYDPETGKGVLLAFCQEQCRRRTMPFSLPFAQEGKRYRFTDEDTGEQFMTEGFGELHFGAPRSSRLLWVEEV